MRKADYCLILHTDFLMLYTYTVSTVSLNTVGISVLYNNFIISQFSLYSQSCIFIKRQSGIFFIIGINNGIFAFILGRKYTAEIQYGCGSNNYNNYYISTSIRK